MCVPLLRLAAAARRGHGGSRRVELEGRKRARLEGKRRVRLPAEQSDADVRDRRTAGEPLHARVLVHSERRQEGLVHRRAPRLVQIAATCCSSGAGRDD